MRARPLAAIALACALTACSGSSNTTATNAGPSAASSASRTAVPSLTLSPPAASQSPSGTIASSPTPATAAQRALAPRAGTYTFRQSGSYSTASGKRDVPDTGTLTVRAATAYPGGGVQQVHERAVSSSRKTTFTYRFTDRGVWLLHVVSDGFECSLAEPLQVLALPMRVGQHLEGETTCREFSSVSFSVTEDVVRTERRSVGGSTIDTFVIKSHIEVSAGAFSQTQDSTTWVSPAHHMVVRAETHAESAGYTADITEQLASLTPR
jgi:hypothetical protein